MNTAICIIGVGAATSLGHSAAVTGTALRAGLTGFCEHPYWIGPSGDPLVVAMARYLPRTVPPMSRIADLASLALIDVFSRLTREIRDVTLLLAHPEPSRIGYPANEIVEALQLRAKNAAPLVRRIQPGSIFRIGQAGGVAALEQAMAILHDERAQFCLVGALDSWLFPDTLKILDGTGRVKSRKNPWGFVPGEAAAFCLLCSRPVATKYNLHVYGELVSAQIAEEQSFESPTAVNTGEGLAKATRAALSGLSSDAEVDEIFCDLNGLRSRADEFGFTVMRVGRRLGQYFRAPASSWGDIGAASTVTAIAAAAILAERGFPRGRRVLVTASSDEKSRGAALLDLPPKRNDEF